MPALPRRESPPAEPGGGDPPRGDSQCWICLGDGGDMITPCECRGTMGRVHEVCLLEWVRRRVLQERCYRPSCPNCSAEYELFEEGEERDRAGAAPQATLVGLVREVSAGMRALPPGSEEREDLVARYGQHALVLVPAGLAVLLGLALLLRFWCSRYLYGAGPPSLKGERAGSMLVCPVRKLMDFVAHPCRWLFGYPAAAAAPPARSGGPGSSGASAAWTGVYVDMQTATMARAFLTLVAAFVVPTWLPERMARLEHCLAVDSFFVSAEGRLRCLVYFQVLPFVANQLRGVLIQAANSEMYTVLQRFLHLIVCNVWTSYLMVAGQILGDALFAYYMFVDLRSSLKEDANLLRSLDRLQTGTLRITDRCPAASSAGQLGEDGEELPPGHRRRRTRAGVQHGVDS